MEYVIELDKKIILPNGRVVKPILLQYNVECPYRICDAIFMNYDQVCKEVEKWKSLNDRGFDEAYLIAANLLLNNLRILHENGILHNAIHEQNYTWALELVDFELACSTKHPYESEEDQRHVKDLFSREIIQTYVIIIYIAGVLGENVNFKKLDAIFSEYGFELADYKVK